MIRRLRLKFVAICMALVTAVLAAVLLSVFFSVRQNAQDLSRQLLYQVVQDGGVLENKLGKQELRVGKTYIVKSEYIEFEEGVITSMEWEDPQA